MRTTLNLDDALLAQVEALAPRKMSRTALVEAALRAYLEACAADQLIKLGGSMPDFEPAPRGRGK